VIHPDDDQPVAVPAGLQEPVIVSRFFFGNPGVKVKKSFAFVTGGETG
jgi:hypothetical protein